MATASSHIIKSLINKALYLPKALNRAYQLTRLTFLLLLSVHNRGFLGPLSILMFFII